MRLVEVVDDTPHGWMVTLSYSTDAMDHLPKRVLAPKFSTREDAESAGKMIEDWFDHCADEDAWHRSIDEARTD